MHLAHTHKLLKVAAGHRDGFLEISDPKAEVQVRLMVSAGLVEATFGDGREGSCTGISRLTDAGRQFLRTFREHTFAADPEDLEPVCAAVLSPPGIP